MFEKDAQGKVFGTEYDPLSIMQIPDSSWSKNYRLPTMRSKNPNNPIPSFKKLWSYKYLDKGLTDNNAFEVNNVYTLAKHCENLGKTWAYGNEQKCTGNGNCIKKGLRVLDGSTCLDLVRNDSFV